MTALLLALVIAQQADTTRTRRCEVVIDSVGGEFRQVTVAPAVENWFAGGGVLAHCRGTNSSLSADSVAWYAQARRIDMVGDVRMRDTAVTLDANLAYYHTTDERLEAHNRVVATNRRTGTVLRGPNLTYARAVPGVRDTTEMRATGRPTIEYRQRPDSADEPYIIVADRVRMRGDDRIWGGGQVTIDRSDFAARGDSLALDQGAGTGVLLGEPVVSGKGTQGYTLEGTRIDLALDGRELRRVMAHGEGRAQGEDWHLTADTIHLALEQRRLQQAFAWGDSSRPFATSARETIRADSLALDVPDQVLREARAFGRAFSTTRRDTTAAADVDWISGDTLTARFDQQPDSTGRNRTEIRQILAWGSARALTHQYDDRQPDAGPAINYSRGRRIDIALRAQRVDRVVVAGEADGLHLEPRRVRPPADTTAPAAPPAPAERP
jgi:hypothetical protein